MFGKKLSKQKKKKMEKVRAPKKIQLYLRKAPFVIISNDFKTVCMTLYGERNQDYNFFINTASQRYFF